MRAILSQWLWHGYGLVMILGSLRNDLVMVGWHTGINLVKSRTTAQNKWRQRK